MPASPEIELRDVRSSRGGYEVLRGLCLSLYKGETLFVMGGAGSGKSVLLKTAAGIRLPDEGEVLFRGKPLAHMSAREEAAFRKASGFVFQDAALWANKSLFDNLALPAQIHEPLWSKSEVESAVRRAAELVGYDQALRARPAELSSGERKLIGLARALVLDPEILFMDDPTSILDEADAACVPDIIDAVKAEGHSVLVASASSNFVSRCADTVAVLLGGIIGARGSYDEAAAWTDPLVRAVTGRLKPREPAAPAWAGGLAGAWVSAFVDDAAIYEGGPTPSPEGNDDTIDDLPGAEPEDEVDEKDDS